MIINELTYFIIDQIILSNKIIVFLMNLHVIIITLFNFFEFVFDKINMKSILIMWNNIDEINIDCKNS